MASLQNNSLTIGIALAGAAVVGGLVIWQISKGPEQRTREGSSRTREIEMGYLTRGNSSNVTVSGNARDEETADPAAPVETEEAMGAAEGQSLVDSLDRLEQAYQDRQARASEAAGTGASARSKKVIADPDTTDTSSKPPTTLELPSVDRSTIELPTIDRVTIEQPSIDQATIEQPTIDSSTIEQPTIDSSTIEQPSIDQSTIEQPTIKQPLIRQPNIQEPKVN